MLDILVDPSNFYDITRLCVAIVTLSAASSLTSEIHSSSMRIILSVLYGLSPRIVDTEVSVRFLAARAQSSHQIFIVHPAR